MPTQVSHVLGLKTKAAQTLKNYKKSDFLKSYNPNILPSTQALSRRDQSPIGLKNSDLKPLSSNSRHQRSSSQNQKLSPVRSSDQNAVSEWQPVRLPERKQIRS